MYEQLRKSITTLAFVAASLASGGVGAQAPSTPPALNADAPDRYVVVPGDTLWGISERFTHSPWRWPELWGLNRDQIKNPHLIFPGNVILLDRATGTLSLAPGTVKLSPKIHDAGSTDTAIPSIPAAVIEPYLTQPLVIEPDGLDNAPTIVATQEDRVIIEAGNRAYVRGIGSSNEEDWSVYRPGQALIDPDTERTLGYEAIYLGRARRIRAGEPSTVQLTKVTQEVTRGDKLVSASPVQAVNYAPHAPKTPIRGRVMTIYGSVGKTGESGPYSIITINRGRADGVEVGHVMALYRYGATVTEPAKEKYQPATIIHLPEERYGLVFVFRVFDRVSYALVMRITRPVHALDVVRNP
ncbi:MAG: LysM domain-containing protein [Burkholderiales bacterium]